MEKPDWVSLHNPGVRDVLPVCIYNVWPEKVSVRPPRFDLASPVTFNPREDERGCEVGIS